VASYRRTIKNIVKRIKAGLTPTHKRQQLRKDQKLLLSQNKQIIELLTHIYGDLEKDTAKEVTPRVPKQVSK
jgi:phosphoenolpyruvate carboxylase